MQQLAVHIHMLQLSLKSNLLALEFHHQVVAAIVIIQNVHHLTKFDVMQFVV
jgi:hypothetical protein